MMSAIDEVTISHLPNPHSGDKEPLLELSPIHIHSIDTLSETISCLKCLDGEQLLSFAGELFSIVAERQQVHVPTDFLPLSLSAMKQLESGGRSNILYGLAQGVGTTRADGSDSLFPTRKIITGLLEYSVNFFNAGNNAQHVSALVHIIYCIKMIIISHWLISRWHVLMTTSVGW